MGDMTIDWFGIPVRDVDAAARFYGAVFQQELVPMEGPGGTGMRVFTAGGTPVGALVAMGEPGGHGIEVYFGAQGDLDAMLERATAAGGSVVVPRTAIGEHGFIAKVTDPDGNRIALHTM